MPEVVTLRAGAGAARIETHGAQLRSLSFAGREVIWQGAPGFWDDSALVLFPVIAGIAGGVARVGGTAYPMPAHGFAHGSDFAVEEASPDSVSLLLEASQRTRASYPFDFALRARFDLAPSRLDLALMVENRTDDTMPCDLGWHPGLRWPLAPDAAKSDHALVFDAPETAPIRRGVEDPIVLRPEAEPSPVGGRVLHPADGLFERQAVVFDRFESRAVDYGVANGPGLRLSFPDSPPFALWMQPGAEFLCLEPWHGLPSPVGYAGELAAKPGIAAVPARSHRTWRFALEELGAMTLPEAA